MDNNTLRRLHLQFARVAGIVHHRRDLQVQLAITEMSSTIGIDFVRSLSFHGRVLLRAVVQTVRYHTVIFPLIESRTHRFKSDTILLPLSFQLRPS